MEFERAIFRVYERSIEGLVHDEPPPISRSTDGPLNKSCQLFEILLLFSGFIFFICLSSLHISYVGNPGCLSEALTLFNSTTNTTYQYKFRKDDILGINIKGLKESSKNSGINDDDYTNHWGGEGFLSGIQYSIEKAKKSSKELFLNSKSVVNAIFKHDHSKLVNMEDRVKEWHKELRSKRTHNSQLPTSSKLDDMEIIMNQGTNSSSSNTTIISTTSNLDHLLDFEYVVAFDEAIFLLDNDLLQRHHFRIINVTLSSQSCFGSSASMALLEALSLFDVAVVNNVMYTAKLPGYVASNQGVIYHWTQQHLTRGHTFGQWFSTKLSIVFNSLLSFFLLSTTTTLLVRVLITSGVILIFPTFWLLRCCGVAGLNLRMVSFSYPWIGHPLQAIRAAGQSPYPFILAHITRVFVYYLLYVAAQAIYLGWLYDDITFGTDQLWLYVVMMLWEYYTMIYLRSSLSIEFFPRISLALFMLYHVYYYSYPSGFHLVALTSMTFLIMAMMTHCVRVYEVKAYRQGLVSIDQPRALYTNLPWPAWRFDLAPDYSIFMPVNSRTNSLYQDNVPNRPNTNGGDENNTQNRAQQGAPETRRRLGPDPMAGPLASLSGTIELRSLFRGRGSNQDPTNVSLPSNVNPPTENRTQSNVVHDLFSQFFPSQQVTNYQSLSTTSLHDTSNTQTSDSSDRNSSVTQSTTISAIHQLSANSRTANEDAAEDHII